MYDDQRACFERIELHTKGFSAHVAHPVTDEIGSRRPYHGSMLTYVEKPVQEENSNMAHRRDNIGKFEASLIFFRMDPDRRLD